MGSAVKWIVTVALLLLISAVHAQADPTGVMAQANTAYENQNYTEAVKLYQLLVDGGLRHERVYFNLGSAYYQTGDLGRALLNWRRAQVFTPRDGDVSRHLALVRQERTDIQGDESGWLEGVAALTAGLLTPVELGWLTLLIWSAWFGLVSLWLLRETWREGLRALLIVGGVVALALVTLLASRLWVDSFRPAAVVVQAQVSAMSGPGTHYLELFPLHAAAEIRIVEQRAGWLRGALPDGRQGWLPDGAVERIEP